MTTRGRPRHPDILTPREWAVLDFLRDSRTNEEIADGLGITLDGAKYHVSSILSKLGVSTREEAAAWAGEPAASRWTIARVALALGGSAVIAATVGGLALLAWGVAESGDHTSEPDVLTEPSVCEPAAPGEKQGPLAIGWGQRVVCWRDIESEVSYSVEGVVSYWQPPASDCWAPPQPALRISEEVKFSQELPADSTQFGMPESPDRELTQVKEFRVEVRALDAGGETIAFDGTAITKDPPLCEPSTSSTAPPVAETFDLDDFVAQLTNEGVIVSETEEVSQPFLSIPGTATSLRDYSMFEHGLNVFIYPDTTARKDESEWLGRDLTVSLPQIEWIARAYGLSRGNVFVIAVTDDADLLARVVRAVDGMGSTDDEWTVVAPEDRSDIQMIDVTQAKLFLPTPADAADCEQGELDPVKAEGVIREWLASNRSKLSHTSIWDQTQILVTCSYPNEEYGGKLALFVGIPYGGYSYIAPRSCQSDSQDLSVDAPSPAPCVPPEDIERPTEVDSHTVIVNPEDVLQ